MVRNNIQFLNDTLKICQRGYYIINEQQISLPCTLDEMRQISVYLPDELEKMKNRLKPRMNLKADPCCYTCENTDTFTMAMKRISSLKEDSPVLVLNFANGVYPGGGVRMGAQAQEEDLCRRSSLLLSLENEQAKDYYAYNKSLHSEMGSDALMITPHVTILKDENGDLLSHPQNVAVMSCAAPNISWGMEGKTEQQVEEMMGERILKILICAYELKYRNLVLGAFGCGAFGNDAATVARLFHQKLKKLDASGVRFQHVDFAVLSRGAQQYNYRCFHDLFIDRNFYPLSIKNNRVLFWHEDEINGCFSNWYYSPFVIDDFCYQHVEQYLMACKAKLFHDFKHYTYILRSDTPQQCKALGKKVTPYDDSQWSKARKDVLLKALTAKFEQNKDLKKMLLDTGDALIAEASPFDRIFGIGMTAEQAGCCPPEQWQGENLLGKVLMEVREKLKGNR